MVDIQMAGTRAVEDGEVQAAVPVAGAPAVATALMDMVRVSVGFLLAKTCFRQA